MITAKEALAISTRSDVEVALQNLSENIEEAAAKGNRGFFAPFYNERVRDAVLLELDKAGYRTTLFEPLILGSMKQYNVSVYW